MPFLNNKFFLKRWIPFILLVLFLLGSIVFFLVLFLFPTSDIHAVEKKEDWIFYAEDNPESTFISRYVKHLPSVKANDRFVMKRKMTNDYKYPTMLLIGDHQHMTVYLDDQEIYTNDEPNDPLTLNHPGKTLSFITLPEDYVGKTLKIYVTSPFDTYSGFPAEVFFGPANALIGYVFSLSILNIYILLFTGFICIINLFYVLVSFINQRRLKISSLLFSGFALTAGLEAGFSDMLGGLLFPPIVNSVMLNILSIITPMFLIGFYCTNMHFIRKY
ncbi:Signal transduction histidine kinase [Enterococcus casseliflavus]|nr:Signal transduction histidine kinase [Enterococcus casseliflavus]